MRIEVKHKQNCPSSRHLRHFLEEVIAEERLPLAVEMTESDGLDEPQVYIGTHEVKGGHSGHFERQRPEVRQFMDRLRGTLLEHWHDHAIMPLLRVQEKKL